MSNYDLSIIVPAYNEANSIAQLLRKISSLKLEAPVSFEILVVDDASTDGTSELVSPFLNEHVRLYKLEKNSGKGAAVRTGFGLARGRFFLVQDADLEYSPDDIPRLLDIALQNPNATIYGSRQKGAKSLGGLRGVLKIWPKQAISSWLFNILLSFWVFFIRKVWISDTLTGYKLYPASVFEDWLPKTSGFETDHEITSRILNLNRNIIEVPIAYCPRSRNEGKKIRSIDGYLAIKTFWRFRK